ncbi:MAG: peroxidase family protein [Sphingomonadaceae bacterium]|nr:peroxidase family protein [Sphingomonadaceae bacterium]
MSGLKDFALTYVLPLLERVAPHWTEELKINFAVSAERGKRPHPYSLWTGMGMGPPDAGATAATAKSLPSHAPAVPALARGIAASAPFAPSGYVSWPGLADRRYTGRHLPPKPPSRPLPDRERVVRSVLLRPEGQFIPCPRTSTLFCFFAQWFTDSFLRTDPIDRRRTTSNHEIDYCQIYGLDERTTWALRERRGGRMKLPGGHLPRLTDEQGAVLPEFADLSYIRDDSCPPVEHVLGEWMRAALARSLPQAAEPDRWSRMYATGLDRGNSTILYTALSTMCVREHNRVAAAIERIHPDWDDDRLFETTRTVMIRNVLAIVVEDYINHLAGDGFRFRLERHFAEHQSWYRSNRISLEFNLLYRWHGMVPDRLDVDGVRYDHASYRFNNAVLERHGVERCINSASTQHAGRIGPFNTPAWLWRAEMASIDMARTFELAPFVDYCARFGRRAPESIAELTGGNERATAALTELYGSVEHVELPVGLICEGREYGDEDAVLPPLVRTMVSVDAFTHIFTNPLLADQVHQAAFEGPMSALGELIDNAGGVCGLMSRSAAPGTSCNPSFAVRAARPDD